VLGLDAGRAGRRAPRLEPGDAGRPGCVARRAGTDADVPAGELAGAQDDLRRVERVLLPHVTGLQLAQVQLVHGSSSFQFALDFDASILGLARKMHRQKQTLLFRSCFTARERRGTVFP
jgi:hypothetical protein